MILAEIGKSFLKFFKRFQFSNISGKNVERALDSAAAEAAADDDCEFDECGKHSPIGSTRMTLENFPKHLQESIKQIQTRSRSYKDLKLR